MPSCAAFEFTPEGWKVFDWFENSWAETAVAVKTFYNHRGQPSLLLLHGTFTQTLARHQLVDRPHKYLVKLS